MLFQLVKPKMYTLTRIYIDMKKLGFWLVTVCVSLLHNLPGDVLVHLKVESEISLTSIFCTRDLRYCEESNSCNRSNDGWLIGKISSFVLRQLTPRFCVVKIVTSRNDLREVYIWLRLLFNREERRRCTIIIYNNTRAQR